MSKISMKPSNMLYPLPAVMVSCGDMKNSNIITLAWVGTVNSEPPRVFISIRKERFSHDMVEKSGEFVINLVGEDLAYAMDWCGCRSGSKYDKFKEMKLTKEPAEKVSCPMIKESPVNIECRIFKKEELGSHDMYLADVLAVHADESLQTKSGRLAIEKLGLVSLIHGAYHTASRRPVGRMGYSVMKPKTKKRLDAKKHRAKRSAKKQ